MRSLSSVIKGGRVLTQTIINLEERSKRHQVVPETYEDPIKEALNEHCIQIKNEAKQEATKILEAAKTEAEEILNNAKIEHEKLQSDVFQLKEETLKGLEQERQNILEEAENKAQSIINDAYAEKQKLIDDAEPEMVQLITRLLGHIIGDAMFENSDWVEVLVKKMISQENISEDICVVTSPQTYEQLIASKENNFTYAKGTITFRQDETLNNSTCVVETSQGDIVYDVQTGLNAVLRELKILQTLQ